VNISSVHLAEKNFINAKKYAEIVIQWILPIVFSIGWIFNSLGLKKKDQLPGEEKHKEIPSKFDDSSNSIH